MRELFDITPHPTGSGFRMRLKTGEIDVPDGCGGYIISSGMGSGKTESIKSLIRQKYDEGILYCVDTRDELKKMYRWIIEELVPVTDLKGTDVMVSSDPEFSYFLDLYKDNPEMLMEKKVILITHVRFFTDLINYFLIYRPQGKVDIFDGDFRTLMTRDDLRRYIVFDETPVQITPFVKFDRSMLGLFTTEDDKGNMVCRSPEGIQRFYNRFLKGSRNDLFSNQSFRINRIKRDVVLGLVPKYYDSWMLSDTDSKEIMFYPVDLCPEGVAISTHVLIFEGAGNILFRGSTRFTLLDTENKYNTITEFRRLDFGLRRRSLDEGKFDRFVERIGKLADRPSLIVCWKDVNDDDEGPGRSGYAERFRKLLSAKGVDPRLFTITYYGAADNKSTNSYRDIEQIFLCGDWSLPNTESARIRRAYGTSTDSQNQKDWYFSQLITRIGIRKHIEGEVYTVWYTDDFDERFIDRMDAYFNENRITGKASVSHKDWEKKLDAMDIRSNTKEGIRLLAKYDKDMQNAIVMDQKYIKEVTFDYLEMIGLKRYARERRNYKKLIELLEKLGITLVIK